VHNAISENTRVIRSRIVIDRFLKFRRVEARGEIPTSASCFVNHRSRLLDQLNFLCDGLHRAFTRSNIFPRRFHARADLPVEEKRKRDKARSIRKKTNRDLSKTNSRKETFVGRSGILVRAQARDTVIDRKLKVRYLSGLLSRTIARVKRKRKVHGDRCTSLARSRRRFHRRRCIARRNVRASNAIYIRDTLI